MLVGSNPLKYSFQTKTLKNSLLKFELNWFWWAGDNVKLVQSGWRLLEYSFHNRNLNLLDQWWRSADPWRWIGLIFSSPKKAGQGILLLIQYVNALCCSLAEELNIILKTVHQKGLLEQIKKKLKFYFCRRILENYWQPLLSSLETSRLYLQLIITC